MSETLKPQSELQLDFLNETIAHYNSKNRGQRTGGGCLYVPIEGQTEGCAIGRKIADKELCKKLDGLGSIGDSIEGNKLVFNALPTELQDLGHDFLNYMQELHDDAANWDENGLSAIGKTRIEETKRKFCLV